VYEMLRSGDTTGVFQLEGAGMRQLIRQLAPDRFEDLMALVALYRPGPLGQNMHVEYAERKHGRKPVTYPHPDLEDILKTTYAFIAYQTAYLKKHHPVEYMAALLTSVKDDKDNKPFYLNAVRLMGIRVLPPDVNQSHMDFTPTDGEIRYGLSAVRNVGEGVVQQITEARTQKGLFESFTDFCRKVDPGVLHKKVLESLILAGAFDSLGYTRGGMLQKDEQDVGAYEKITTPILSDRRAE